MNEMHNNARQVLFRNFHQKMPGIEAGTTTAFLHCMRPQPPKGYEYRGQAFNGMELFTDGNCAYFFPRRIYSPGEFLYIREEWAIAFSEDGTPGFVYKAGMEDTSHVLWKPASYMPVQAARFFLEVKSTGISRIGQITIEDAKALGFGGRSWRRDLEAVWDGDLRKAELPELSYHEDPWVQIVRFRRIGAPEGWPEGINERILDQGSDYKSYTIRLAETGEIIAKGTAVDCAKAMGYKNTRRVYTLIGHVNSGINSKYTVEITQEPRASRTSEWLRGDR